jgi:hypothetical protein
LLVFDVGQDGFLVGDYLEQLCLVVREAGHFVLQPGEDSGAAFEQFRAGEDQWRNRDSFEAHGEVLVGAEP